MINVEKLLTLTSADILILTGFLIANILSIYAITTIKEKLKASSWKDQKQWELKRELLMKYIEKFHDLHSRFDDLLVQYNLSKNSKKDACHKTLKEISGKIVSDMDTITKLGSNIGILMKSANFDTFNTHVIQIDSLSTQFLDSFMSKESTENLIEIIEKLRSAVNSINDELIEITKTELLS